MKRFLTYLFTIVIALQMLVSCGEDRTYEYEAKTQHNHWAYDVVLDTYLWADSLNDYTPGWKSFFSTPSSFLSTLTSKSKQNDKWSYVLVDTLQEDAHQRGYFNHYNSYGFDFVLMTDPTGQSTRSVLRVLTVYPNSPAEQAGLVRNDFICAYGSYGEGSSSAYKISSKNVSRFQKGIARSLEVRHLAQDETEGVFYWEDTVTVLLGESRYVEDVPFPVSRIIETDGMKIGYLMCTRLLEGPLEQTLVRSASAPYRDQLDGIMAQMQQAHVSEMVLDLRLCNDGTLDMARRLASYVVNPSALHTTFAQTIWNKRYEANNLTLPYDASVANLNLSRVYILTSAYTQGAAEWVIRSLQYSMGEENVIIIGQKTAGQDVMTQEVGANYHVHLFPVVAYVTDGGGRHGLGAILPSTEVKEQDAVFLGEYGSPDDILLYTALANILGIGQNDTESSSDSDNSAE